MFRNQYNTNVTMWMLAGWLFQVEYAMETINLGSDSPGWELSSRQKKIFKVDNHIGIAIASLTTIGCILSCFMPSECIKHAFIYESPLSIIWLVIQLANKAQPNGVALLVDVLDESGAHLYYSGNYIEHQAFAIRSHSQAAKSYLRLRFENFIDFHQTIRSRISICVVTEVGVGEQFHILDQAKVQQLINAFELMEEEEPQSAEPSPGDQAAVEGEGASPDQAAAPMKI
ncbi:hypothetical protein ACJRO7_023958 [Eucalyptus globulus]|uniref:Uncharacterized protein n=1 Tax=Eucalyptus globulus TaxID=34317 RepID=A0ABD3KCQ5_EUCGL